MQTRYPRAILVSCEIPWDEQENLMEDLFREEVRRFLASGFRHVYVFGTAGEGYAVDTARFRQITKIFYEETRGADIFPQVGVIGLSTANIRERVSIAHGIGFRTFQISLPSWGALNDRETLRFFKDVCLAYPDSQFLHYNLLRTKRLLSAADYRRIADEVPNLVATKNTSPDVTHTAALMKTVPDLQHFFGEATFPAGCLRGECSLLSSFAALFPSKTKELFAHACAGRVEELLSAQVEYLEAVEEIIAPMRRQALIDGAYDKMLVRLGGGRMPLRLLSPYESFSEETYAECKRILDRKYSSWLV
jgi:dihydrodipicolinate synthase/N-acetylneuraminate lyase